MISWWVIAIAFYLVLGTLLIGAAFKEVEKDSPTLYESLGNVPRAIMFIIATCIWPLVLFAGFFVSGGNR